MNSEDLKRKTKLFAIEIINLVEFFPKSNAGFVTGKQIIRSAASVGANYRSACRAKSKADFVAKLSIVEEEADETMYWPELATECGLISIESGEKSLNEANELTAIFTASRKTAKGN
ncbi:MAG TPA: four helix bundle protein [Candidatus Paceibacterota bacterium]|nr:four helix bundle protein [Candidatus Paceibacterota bacterium]